MRLQLWWLGFIGDETLVSYPLYTWTESQIVINVMALNVMLNFTTSLTYIIIESFKTKIQVQILEFMLQKYSYSIAYYIYYAYLLTKQNKS